MENNELNSVYAKSVIEGNIINFRAIANLRAIDPFRRVNAINATSASWTNI
jgi:hypothetical protein